MYEKYQELKAAGDYEKLYLLDLSTESGQRLIFCGSRHTNNPKDIQYQEMGGLFKGFLKSENSKKIVMSEGQVRPVEKMTLDEAILYHGDPGFTCWNALNQNIKLISPEPDTEKEISILTEEFGSEKTALYYFARQMHQWARSDFKVRPNWQEYAESFLKSYSIFFPDITMTVQNLSDFFRQETGKVFSWTEIDILYKISCPVPESVASRCSGFRDEFIFRTIEKYWNEGYDIFIVYGSGHAIVQEPALRGLKGLSL
jgi:tRNA-binding EMAP/Myf-like protein